MSLSPWGLGGCWGLGGLIRSHGSLARSIPHSPNLLYVLNLQQQKSCDRLRLLVQIEQYEKSWTIGVYCPPMGIWDCRAAGKESRRLVILEEFTNPITFLRSPCLAGIHCDKRSVLGNTKTDFGVIVLDKKYLNLLSTFIGLCFKCYLDYTLTQTWYLYFFLHKCTFGLNFSPHESA